MFAEDVRQEGDAGTCPPQQILEVVLFFVFDDHRIRFVFEKELLFFKFLDFQIGHRNIAVFGFGDLIVEVVMAVEDLQKVSVRRIVLFHVGDDVAVFV